MYFSSATLVLFASTAALAAPSAERRSCTASAIPNGSFESGAAPWQLAGAASIVSNSPLNPWAFTATDGKNFAILQSTPANPTSSLTTSLSGLDYNKQWTLSFDWRYEVVSGRSAPDQQCTLQSGFGNGGFVIQSWTRGGENSGTGHVAETLPIINLGASDFTIAFSCDPPQAKDESAVEIDNVKFIGC